jgi:citrate lyase subunit beta/citryl-CoA lyase
VSQDQPFKPRRSLLFMPASNPRAIEKALHLPCDGVVLDLEDSVAPEAKTGARAAAAEAIARGFGARDVVLRCNSHETPWALDDVLMAAQTGPDALLAPKVRTAADIRAYDAALAGAPERTRLWAMIETPAAVLNLRELAELSETTRLAGFVLGLNDLGLELRARPSPGRAAMLPVLAQTVIAARSHGLLAFDGTFNVIDDEAGLTAECRQAVDIGFDGKTLIHPAQIGPCNAAFSPSAEEAAWARKVVAAFTGPKAEGKGALQLEGRMIERLHLKEAERTLRLAQLPVR